MSELSANERRTIVADRWENLGRIIAELAHIGSLHETSIGPGFRITGTEYLEQATMFNGPRLIFTGHIRNWEIIPSAAFARGMDLAFMYRAASNPLVDALMLNLRQSCSDHKITMFAKGSVGARGAYAHLTLCGNLAMLIDQKLDNAISVPFSKRPVMTAPAFAIFALKFRCPVIPIHVVRDAAARLHIICGQPLTLPNSGNRVADTLAVMTTVNQILERWIRDVPSSWLWLPRRWPKPGSLSS